MAETLTAQLALELGGFTAGLQAAAQAFRQFTTDLTTQIQQLATAFTPLQKAVEETGRQRTAVAKATAAAVTATERQLQRDLEAAQRAQIKLQTDLDLERLKIREQQAKVAGAALVNLQRDNIAILLGIEKEQLEQEKALLNAETAQVRATLAAQAALRKEQIIVRQAEQRAQAAVDAAFAQEQLATEKALQAAVVALYKQDTQVRQAEQRAQAAVDAAFAQEQKQQAARAATDRASTRKALEESVNYQTRILIAQGSAIEKEAAEVSKRLYKETAAEKNRILKTGTDEEKQILTATEAFRRDLAEKRVAFEKSIEDRLATERRLRNNQLRAELTNVRSGAVTPGAQPGAAPTGNQLPFQIAYYAELARAAEAAAGSQSLLTTAFATFGSTLSTLGIVVALSSIVRAFKDFSVGAVNAAIQFQSLQAVFRGTSGGVRQGGEAMAFVRDEATRLGVNFVSLATSYKNFNAASSALNIETKESREIFLSFANAARALGLSSDQLQHILVAVEQIMSKGKVSAEELRRQLGNSLPGAFAIAARSIGVTTSELDKMLKQGALVSSDFILPFAREVQRTFGSLVPEQTQTAQAAFERFYNEIKFLTIAFGDSIIGAFKPALDFINKVLEGYRKEREAREGLQPAALRAPQGESLGEVQRRLDDTADRINALRILLQKQEATQSNEFDITEYAKLLPASIGNRGNAFIPNINLQPLKELIESQGFAAGIAKTREELAALEKEYQKLLKTKERLDELLSDTGGASGEALVPFRKELKDITEFLKVLEEDLGILAKRRELFDVSGVTEVKDTLGDTEGLVASLSKELAFQQERYKAIEKAAEDVAKAIATNKGLQKEITPEIQAQVEKVRSKLAVQALSIQQLELEIEKQKDIGKGLEAGDKQRREGIAKRQRDIEDAITEELREEEKSVKEKLKLIKEYVDAHLDIEKAITLATSKETRSRVDDLRAKLAEEVKYYQDRRVEQEEIDKLITARTAEIHRVQTEELAKELKRQEALIREQEKPWRELGTRIENILASTFERILQGTTNILDGIKDAFIKLLARLAAEAAAAQIIIGIKAVVGGSLGAGAASLASTVFGVSGGGVGGTVDTAGIVGSGSGAGGGTLGVAQEALGGLSSAYSIYGGLTGQQSVTGGLLNSLGAGSLLSTPLFGTGVGVATGAGTGSLASLGATTAPAFYGSGAAGAGGIAGGGGAFFGTSVGVATGSGTGSLTSLGATAAPTFYGSGAAGGIAGGGGASAAGASSTAITGSTILAGAGAGIAAGLLISQLLEAIGFGGTGNSVLSGAAGGAIAGTIILPGVGTLIGAGVGALGGYIASLVGGGKRRPQIDIQNVEGGPVSFNETLGGLTFDPFRITNAPFRDIGQILPNVGNKPHQTTYSNFIAAIGDAANQYFGGIIEGFRSLQPQVQQALVQPLSVIAEQIRQHLEQTKFSGNDALQQLQDYFSTKLPEFTQNLLRPLTEALDKIDPYVSAFNEVIEEAQTRIEEVVALQAQGRLAIATQQANIRRGGSPGTTELLLDRLATLGQLEGRLPGSTGQESLTLGNAIQEIVADIVQLADALRGQVEGLTTSLSEQTAALQDSGLDTFALLIRRQEQLARALQDLSTATGTTRLTMITQAQALVQGIQGITDELAAQKQQLLDSLRDQIHDLEEGLFSPAQVFVRRQEELATAREEFAGASSARKAELVPVIQALVQDLFTLGRGEDVLGQDPQLVRNTQADLLGILRELQDSTIGIFSVVDQQEATTATVLETLQDSLGSLSEGLNALPEYLIGVLDQVQASNDAVFTTMIDLLQQQVTLAQEQIDLLINGLQNPEGIDALLPGADAILGDIRDRIQSTADDPNATAALQTELLQGQFLSLQDLVQIGGSQVGLLGQIRNAIGGSGRGDDGESEGGFARGSNYIPYNMLAYLHQGEAVIPRHQNTGGGGPLSVNITVNGSADAGSANLVAERVVQYIEQRSGRLQASRIQVRK